MLIAIFTMDNGKMIRHMDLGNTRILMEPNMKVIGQTINNTVRVEKNGLMELSTKAITSMVKKMDLENSYGLIDPVTKEIFSIIIFTGMGNINGQMEDCLSVIGFVIKCMVLVFLLGLTEEDIRENTLMTRNRVMEYSLGLMEDNMMEHG